MIFQSPREALNPVIRVGCQITQVLRIKRGMSKQEAREEAVWLAAQRPYPDPQQRLRAYPHELSGGLAQRIMIALALSSRPRLLIADEPTTGLDVTTQYQMVQLLRELRKQTGMAILLITHDLALTAGSATGSWSSTPATWLRWARSSTWCARPGTHTQARSLRSRPRVGMTGDIPTIPGSVADLMRPPSGCRFHPRCPNALEVCAEIEPGLERMIPGQRAACHNPVPVREEVAASGR